MEYQLTKETSYFLDKIEREEKKMLWKFYDLKNRMPIVQKSILT